MTECCDSILWIAIVAFMVPSARPALPEDMEGVCWRNVSIPQHRNLSYIQTYKSSERCPYRPWANCDKTESRIAYKTEIKVVWVIKWTCCEGYNEKNATCQPKCSSKCTNGYCVSPEVCACNYGWRGKSCNESFLCSLHLNSSEGMSEPFKLKNVSAVIKHLSVDRKLPECRLNCREQLSNMTVVGSIRTPNSDSYFLHIDSSCNSIDTDVWTYWKKYSILIGAVIGIVSLAMGAFVLYMMRRRRKIRCKNTNGPTQLTLTYYMEENSLYSQ